MISTGRLRARILLGATVLLFFNAFAVLSNRQMALAGDVDFRALYAAGALVRTGHAVSLYNYDLERQTQNTLIHERPVALPFLYPPYAALPFVPLSALSYRTAYLLFLALNLLLLATTAYLLRPWLLALYNLWPPLPLILFLCFLPVSIALFQGQVSIVLLLLFSSSFVAIERQRPFLAGLFLSLALIKLHVVLPVILLFVIWQAWPLIAGFLTGASALTLLSVAVSGPTGLRAYAQSLTEAASTGTIGTQHAYNVFAAQMPNLQGLAFALLGPIKLGSSLPATLLVLLLSATILLWTALQPPSLPRALVAGLLVSYHLHLHDLTLILLPISLALNQPLALNRKLRTQNPKPKETSPPQSPHTPSSVFPVSSATVAALLWMLAPLHLLLMGTGWKSLFAPLMLPFLLRPKPQPEASFSLSTCHSRKSAPTVAVATSTQSS